jgi:hypothetical protein
MLGFTEEQALSKDIVGFQNYMFSTTEKFTKRHSSFKNDCFLICEGDKCFVLNNVEDMASRQAAVQVFNNALGKFGISPTSSGDRLVNGIVYLGEETESDSEPSMAIDFATALIVLMDFAKEKECPVIASTHWDQIGGNGRVDRPHLHYVLPADKAGELYKYING